MVSELDMRMAADSIIGGLLRLSKETMPMEVILHDGGRTPDSYIYLRENRSKLLQVLLGTKETHAFKSGYASVEG